MLSSIPVRRVPLRLLPRQIQFRYASGGAPKYNEPTGYLWGESPPPPGQKRKREDWELIWYIGMYGTMAFIALGLYFKPDTSIQTWALREAKARMEARGEEIEYKPKTP